MDLPILTVSDDYEKRFKSYGWDYIKIDGHNFKEIFKALKNAQKSKKPIAISCKTTIGYGSPNKGGKASSHGSPLGDDELNLVRKKLKWNYEPFKIPDYLLNDWRRMLHKKQKKKMSLNIRKKQKVFLKKEILKPLKNKK